MAQDLVKAERDPAPSGSPRRLLAWCETRRTRLVEGRLAFRAGMGLTAEERSVLEARFAALDEWSRPATGRLIAAAVAPVILTMYQSDAGELEGVRAAAYRTALSGLPALAIEGARDAILRGEALGLDRHFAPTPAEFAAEARRHLGEAMGERGVIAALLAAVEEPPTPPEPSPEERARRNREAEETVLRLAPHTRTAAEIRRRRRAQAGVGAEA